jgi:hypothetical protein
LNRGLTFFVALHVADEVLIRLAGLDEPDEGAVPGGLDLEQ